MYMECLLKKLLIEVCDQKQFGDFWVLGSQDCLMDLAFSQCWIGFKHGVLRMGSQLEDMVCFKIIQFFECKLHVMATKEGRSSCSGPGYLTAVLTDLQLC